MTVFEVFINFYQGILLTYAYHKQLRQKPHSIWWEVGAVCLFGGAQCFFLFYGHPTYEYIIFIIPLLYSFFTVEKRDGEWLFVSIFNIFVFVCATLLIGNLLCFGNQTNWDALLEQTSVHLSYVVAANITLTLIFYLLSNLRKRNAGASISVTVLFIVLLLISSIIGECIFQMAVDPNKKQYASISMLCLFAGAVLLLLLYEIMAKAAERKREYELVLQATSAEQQHRNELQTIYSEMLAEQHDLRHRLSAAEELLSASDAMEDTTKQSVIKLLHPERDAERLITGNTVMDAILTTKQAVMRRAGIKFDFTPCPLSRLPIPEQDFCVLISNLLDNAIEGVMRLPASGHSRRVTLKFSLMQEMFSISCVNDADSSTIQRRGDSFLSSKKHAEIHGFGTKSIRQIVENNDGMVTFAVGSSLFSVEIMLPMPQEV